MDQRRNAVGAKRVRGEEPTGFGANVRTLALSNLALFLLLLKPCFIPPPMPLTATTNLCCSLTMLERKWGDKAESGAEMERFLSSLAITVSTFHH